MFAEHGHLGKVYDAAVWVLTIWISCRITCQTGSHWFGYWGDSVHAAAAQQRKRQLQSETSVTFSLVSILN